MNKDTDSRKPSTGKEKGAGGSTCGKFLLYFFIWLVIWLIIGGGLFFYAGRDPTILLGVGAAALLSLVLMLYMLGGAWKGQIIDIHTEKVRVQHGDDDSYYEDQEFAIIRLTNGKTKKMRRMPEWETGDWIEKKRGEGWYRKL